MITREHIDSLIEAYAKAIKDRNPKAIAALFAERFDHIVHGVGSDPSNPWNTKRESNREGIIRVYEDFFLKVTDIAVEYTDRIIDTESNSAAMVVRVKSGTVRMENALYIKWNDEEKIIAFYNWYGQAPG